MSEITRQLARTGAALALSATGFVILVLGSTTPTVVVGGPVMMVMLAARLVRGS